jgi:glycosyltransferase involved in cell wall biosynthesis
MDKKGCKVTIATISYNSSQYIKYAIESVLCQSFTDFEYIISDDCSTDNTWEIIKEYKDPRIRCWRNDKNLGEYPNRNKTLFEAKGEYIIWLDGDDILYPHGLDFMVKMLDAFPESAMACARPYWPNMVYPYELTPREAFLYDYLGSPVTINGFPDTLFKTEIIKKLGGLPIEYISGDTVIKKRIATFYKILLVSNGISWWRMPIGQASSRLRGTIQGTIENINIGLMFLQVNECPLIQNEKDRAISNLLGNFYRQIIRNYFLHGKIRSFLKYWNYLDIGFIKKISYVFTRINLPYKGNANAENPLILSFDHNPFSNINK